MKLTFTKTLEKLSFDEDKNQIVTKYEDFTKELKVNGTLKKLIVIHGVLCLGGLTLFILGWVILGVFDSLYSLLSIGIGFAFLIAGMKIINNIWEEKENFAEFYDIFALEKSEINRGNGWILAYAEQWRKEHEYAELVRCAKENDLKKFDEMIKNLMKNA